MAVMQATLPAQISSSDNETGAAQRNISVQVGGTELVIQVSAAVHDALTIPGACTIQLWQ